MGINSLLLAHHEDDQAETILMRLSNGQGANGLLGMKTPAGIPECYGIHGAYESGGKDSTPGGDVDRRKSSFSAAFSPSRSDSSTRCQLPIETGGIQVYRPFLHFSKARLIATCMTENMKWFEDHTNTEPTTTMRNAIRHMYSNHSMPAALSKPALLALSTRLNDNAARRFDIMKSWLAKCKVTRLETCTGTVKVRFADSTQVRWSDNVWPPLDASRIAAELLREVILLVTPREHIERSSLHSTVHYIFPEICQEGEHTPHTTAFTASGVYFQPILTTLPHDKSPIFLNKKPEWFLSRQPHDSESLLKVQFDVPAIGGSWSPWYFYDGRYWIRVQNLGTASLLIQPFSGKHLAEFRASLTRSDESRLRWDLKKKAPGKVRWTLPAIVRKEEDGKEMLIALPSINLSIPECMVRWEIRYKNVPAQFIASGVLR
jgi:tRNA(Ile)-lysidine synthase